MKKVLKWVFVIISALMFLGAIFIPAFVNGGVQGCLVLLGGITLAALIATWGTVVAVVFVDLISGEEDE